MTPPSAPETTRSEDIPAPNLDDDSAPPNVADDTDSDGAPDGNAASSVWVPPSWPSRPVAAKQPKRARLPKATSTASKVVAAQDGGGSGIKLRVAALSAAIVVVGIGATAAVMTKGQDQSIEPTVTATAAASSAAPATSNPATTESCAARSDGALVIGNGPGGTGSGPDVVLGFQYAYYVLRSGAAARAFVAPEVAGLDPAMMQAGIDHDTPVGTTHCVTVVALAADRYAASIDESRTAGKTITHKETITTRTDPDGHVWITSIAAA